MNSPDVLSAVPSWIWFLQMAGFTTAYAGAELNARMRIEGFYLWLVSNLALAAVHAHAGLWLLLLLDLFFLRVNLRGATRWARQAHGPGRRVGLTLDSSDRRAR